MSYEGDSSLSVHHETPSFVKMDPINSLHRAKLEAHPEMEESICTDDELLEIIRSAKRAGKDTKGMLMGAVDPAGATLDTQWINTQVPARTPHTYRASNKYESDAEHCECRNMRDGGVSDLGLLGCMDSSYTLGPTHQVFRGMAGSTRLTRLLFLAPALSCTGHSIWSHG